MNVGSLFSGIGGIELGFEREGFTTAWFVEKEPYCQAVLKQHFPNARIYGDITMLKFSELERVDVLTGGFPCQDISVAGKQEGIRGKRSGLWKYYAEAIRILRPRVALVENVPALTYLGLNEVLADLAKIRYDAEWFTLQAKDFGAPHKRERVFIIAYSWSSKGRNAIQSEEKNTTENGRRTESNPNATLNFANDVINRTYKETNREFNQNTSSDTSSFGAEETRQWVIPHFVTNDWSERIQRFRDETIQRKQGFQRFQNVRSVEDLFNRSNIPQPLIRRGSDGVSRRLDSYIQKERTQAIGNAVVPQVAQFIARRIKEVIS